MNSNEHIHILGIAGHAMRGVALALKESGFTVTGTDPNAYSPGSDWLDEHGLTWWREPSADHLKGVSIIVVGGGVPVDFLELTEGIKRGIKTTSYPEMVGELVQGAKRIVVTGTHGKTTTTSMIAWILESAGRKPDFLIGIKPNNFDSSVRLKHGEVAVLEGDEYRSSSLDKTSKFKYYQPDVVIITSIEHDHPDLFPDLQSVKDRFVELVSHLPRYGRLYVCGSSEEVVDVAANSSAPITTYGEDAEWRAAEVEYTPKGLVYKIVRHGKILGSVGVSLYGYHNVLNSLAAAAVTMGEGVSFEQLTAALKRFEGASRRFERISPPGSKVTVIDDYAHHPTEVSATIAAARQHFKGRVIVVFRPHTYSRTSALLTEYQNAFKQADKAYIVPIEGARETNDLNVSGLDIAKGAGLNVEYQPDRQNLVGRLVEQAQPDDVILCMSVNGYDHIVQEIADKLA